MSKKVTGPHPTPEDKRKFPFLGQRSWDQINKDEARENKQKGKKK